MIIALKNMSKSFLNIYVNDEYEINVFPHEEKNIDLDLGGKETFKISVSPNKNSIIKNNLYHIVLNVSYMCSDFGEIVEFIITREKIRFTYNAFYERFFVESSNAICALETIKPLDEERLKKIFDRNCKYKFLLSEPFEDFLGLPMFVIIIGIVLFCSFGWKVTFIYSIFAYLFLILMNVVIKKIVRGYFKKYYDFDEKKIFYEYLEKKYISEYYASTNREPFLGKKKWIETE